jgi:hypothetical protein
MSIAVILEVSSSPFWDYECNDVVACHYITFTADLLQSRPVGSDLIAEGYIQ